MRAAAAEPLHPAEPRLCPDHSSMAQLRFGKDGDAIRSTPGGGHAVRPRRKQKTEETQE